MKNITEAGKWIGIGIGLVLLYKFIEKQSLMVVIERSMGIREGAVIKGMLLGDTSGFDKEFWENLKRSGLVHLMVVSGSNVVIIGSSLVEGLAGFLGRKKTIVGVLAILWGYGAMVGWEAPVIRALLLISIYYLAQILGRKYEWKRGLLVTVGIMILADVTMISSISFWMSLAAFLGVMTIPKKIKVKGIFKAAIETIWVSLWVTPIVAWQFGKISLVSPITNGMVVGLVELVTIGGAIGAIAGVIWQDLGRIILMSIEPVVGYLVWVVNGLGGLKIAQAETEFNWLLMTGWYLILGFILKTGGRRFGGRQKQ